MEQAALPKEIKEVFQEEEVFFFSSSWRFSRSLPGRIQDEGGSKHQEDPFFLFHWLPETKLFHTSQAAQQGHWVLRTSWSSSVTELWGSTEYGKSSGSGPKLTTPHSLTWAVTSCVTLGNSLNFPGSRFLQPEYGNNYSSHSEDATRLKWVNVECPE